MSELSLQSDVTTRWFSAVGAVRYTDGVALVYLGGTLLGQFEPGDLVARDLLIVALANDPRVHLGHLAEAFGLSTEMVRRIRRTRETDGISAIVLRTPRGTEKKLTAKQVSAFEARFDAGATIDEVFGSQRGRGKVARATIGRVRHAWAARAGKTESHVSDTATPSVSELPGIVSSVKTSAADNSTPSDSVGSVDEDLGTKDVIEASEPRSCAMMQHAGTWLMIAVVARIGMHAAADAFRERRVLNAQLRVALDACVAALAIGEKCIEGARRLATPSGGAMMRADHAPAASWVRRILGAFAADGGAARFHLRMLGNYLRAHQRADEIPTVFYVDNHLRPYTGSNVIRRGWRMQDKRVTPGCTDFYVHDEGGTPLYRFTSPEHESLTEHLGPIARLIRLALGPEQRILLVFDRGGSFPVAMSELRDDGFEFVTYERKPYPILAKSAFTRTVEIGGERFAIYEGRKNLGKGRGRVRRIAVLTPEQRQVNLLAISEQRAEWLITMLFGRWSQENGLKHGVERWGINQLDGRTTEAYPPDTVIPNPARRRLGHALRVARVREGDARRALARLANDDPGRAKYESEIAAAMEEQSAFEARLPSTPTHARLEDTELAGKLVRHTAEYKVAVDTVRIACANAETELAQTLAEAMRRPDEAKRALRNLILAPGSVRVSARSITVTLMPAGTRSELAAFERLLADVNSRNLVLPGDRAARPLRFGLQLQ